jgi:hypothetical protein
VPEDRAGAFGLTERAPGGGQRWPLVSVNAQEGFFDLSKDHDAGLLALVDAQGIWLGPSSWMR